MGKAQAKQLNDLAAAQLTELVQQNYPPDPEFPEDVIDINTPGAVEDIEGEVMDGIMNKVRAMGGMMAIKTRTGAPKVVPVTGCYWDASGKRCLAFFSDSIPGSRVFCWKDLA